MSPTPCGTLAAEATAATHPCGSLSAKAAHPLRHPCGTLGALAGATRAELERIIAIDRQALRLGRAKLAGLSGREYDEEKKVGCLLCYLYSTSSFLKWKHVAHRLDTTTLTWRASSPVRP